MVNFWLLLYGRQKPGAEQICAVITLVPFRSTEKTLGKYNVHHPWVLITCFLSNTALLGYIQRT